MSTLEFTLAALLGFQSVAWIATDFASRPPTSSRDRFGESVEQAMGRGKH